MKRNNDRIWYDKGYSDGTQDKRKENTIPKLLGAMLLSVLLIFDQYWILTFVVIYAAFELQEWYDLKQYHESDPPEPWDT